MPRAPRRAHDGFVLESKQRRIHYERHATIRSILTPFTASEHQKGWNIVKDKLTSETRAEPAGPDASAADACRLPVSPWLIVFALLVLQFCLFRRYVAREIAWAYPAHFDQAVYLERSYETFDAMTHEGFFHGLAQGAGYEKTPPVPNGALLHVQAAVLFYFFGPGRTSALTLNFFYFALFQLALVETLLAITRRWSFALIGLGLLLTTRAAFHSTAGIADFRMDFGAFCLFGIFISLVLRSRMFEHLGWSIAALLAGAYTIAFRFITAAYVIPIIGLALGALIILRVARRDEKVTSPPAEKPRLRNLLISVCIAIGFTAPIIWHHWRALFAYYYRFHATGLDKHIRATLFKTASPIASLTYYPRTVALHDVGPGFFILTAALIATVWLWKKSIAFNFSRRTAVEILFVLACAIIPLAVLTWDADKNAAVGAILVAPVLWLVILALRGLLTTPVSAAQWRTGPMLAAIALITGLAVQIISYTRHSEFTRDRAQTLRILELYDRIDSMAHANSWQHPAIANNSFADFLFSSAINVSIYERHRHVLGAHEELATDLIAVSPGQTIDELSHSDFALIAWPRAERSVQSPFQRSMESQRVQIDTHCASHFRKIDQIRTKDFDITLFARN